jgi:hypothetical protein
LNQRIDKKEILIVSLIPMREEKIVYLFYLFQPIEREKEIQFVYLFIIPMREKKYLLFISIPTH